MRLTDLGCTSHLDLSDQNEADLVRIIAVHLSYFKAISIEGEINCYLTGRLRHDPENKITVGDWCTISPRYTDKQNKPAASINNLLPRRSKISRLKVSGEEQVLAANIDYCFIVTSANDDINIKRLDRYLQVAKEGNVKPVIILSKVDICQDFEAILLDFKSNFKDIDIHGISVTTGFGLESIESYVSEKGQTGVCLGSSGVGKSTLINYILGEQKQTIREVRAFDSKGKHTTTARELFFTKGGGMIIDTPGIREVQPLTRQIVKNEIFELISKLELRCKFSNCKHDTEPNCAIKPAIKSRKISSQDLVNFLKFNNARDE